MSNDKRAHAQPTPPILMRIDGVVEKSARDEVQRGRKCVQNTKNTSGICDADGPHARDAVEDVFD